MARIAIPASVGYFFNTMYNLVDTYFGGRLSSDGLAALSMSLPVFLILLSLGFGISSGAGALIANAVGAKEEHKAKTYHVQAIVFAIGVAIISTVIVLALLPAIYRLFGAEGELLTAGLRYARVLVAGSGFLVVNYTLNAGLSARGDTKSLRNVLIVGFLLNVGLDPLLMYGISIRGATIIPAMYEAGIALATILIQALSFFYLLRRVRKSGILKGEVASSFKPNGSILKEVIGQSAPTALSMMTMALGSFIITYYVSRYGSNAVAAYGASLRIEQVALIPTIGLNVALATLVGQNNGAGKMDRVTEAFRTSLIIGAAIMLIVLPPILIFARPLMRIFTQDAEIIKIGMSYLYIEAVTFYSYIVLFQSNSVLQGLKKPGMIMWVGLYRQIPAPLAVFSLLVFVFQAEITGIWWGLAVVNWSAALFILAFALRLLNHRRRDFKAPAPSQASPTPSGA